MLTIIANAIPHVTHPIIFKDVSDIKNQGLRTKRETQLRQKEITQYFSGVKMIFHENAYVSEDVILIWIEEMLPPSLNTAYPSAVILDTAKFYKTTAERTLLKGTT